MSVATGDFKRADDNSSGHAQLNALAGIVCGTSLISGAAPLVVAALPIIAVPALAVGIGVGAAAIRKRMK